jgi:hypothetical protein
MAWQLKKSVGTPAGVPDLSAISGTPAGMPALAIAVGSGGRLAATAGYRL